MDSKDEEHGCFSGNINEIFVYLTKDFSFEVSGSFCNCLLPENIQITAVTHLPDHPAYSGKFECERLKYGSVYFSCFLLIRTYMSSLQERAKRTKKEK